MKPFSHFRLMKSPAQSYSFISFSLDSSRPDCYLEQLEFELKRKSIEGTVLLDLLLANGNNSRRFIEVSFNGESLNWVSAKTKSPNLLDTKIISYCQKFYNKNKDTLSNSVLTSVEKHKILSGIKLASTP